ncbi:MAG TPA: DUF2971 domain-containing protein [Fluviicola sp.]|nr:DUF2971 domain-containing protein [Fluviicola sp.]
MAELQEKYIYRYLTFEKLIDFLETGSLHLTRMDCFEDNLEGIEPYEITELDQIDFLEKLKNPTELNPKLSQNNIDLAIQEITTNLRKVQTDINTRQQEIFVSCWILSNVESFAMWDIYGKSGFALRFEREYFEKLIQDSIHLQAEPTNRLELLIGGTVQYQNFDEMSSNEKESNLPYSFFRKHLSFRHEVEYRIVGCGENLDATGLKFKLSKFDDSEFEIIANPRLDNLQLRVYQNIVSRYSNTHSLQESKLKKWLNFKIIDF